MAQDYYQILGVGKDANERDIKKAYKRMAMKYHPDRTTGDKELEAKFKEIKQAYEVLSDPQKRQMYDQYGHEAFQQARQGGGAGAGGFGGGGADFADIFGDVFGDIFGGGRRQQSNFQGEDQHAKIEVPLEVAYTGSTQQISLQIQGFNAQGQPEIQRKTLNVKIPKGMKEGQQIRLSGQGQAGVNGGKNGDLYIEITYQEDQRQYVEGADVYSTVDITPWEAALGEKIEVNTPAGRIQIGIPKDARNGQKLRLKDKGIPNAQGAGHLYLILNIVTPKANTDTQREAYQAFAEAFKDFQPRA